MLKRILVLLALSLTMIKAFAGPIEDNSFLLEEAYNQEEGIVQFIQSFQQTKARGKKSTLYTFTNEWPLFGQTHQLSYTIPYSKLEEINSTGVGDILLNYRNQIVNTEQVALAPRFSLVLPTGKRESGLGSGAIGFQFNMPLSVVLSDKWVTHWNAGFTLIPKAKGISGNETASIFSTNFGTSFIYLYNDNFNGMLEMVLNSNESSVGNGSKEREETIYISPGFRYALNYPTTQVVVGLSSPIGVGPSEQDEYSGLLYLSIEPKLW